MQYDELRKNFEAHGFTVCHFATAAEAAGYLDAQIDRTEVAFGGSVTLREMGLYERLTVHNTVHWHWVSPGADTLRAAREAKVYLTSANGIAETGEIVNIDGTGNRVSMMLHGPERLYIVAGCNKVTPDLPSAIARAKQIAAPKNAQRLAAKTPCAAAGDRCYDCNSPGRICHGTVILERPCNGMQVELVLIDEALGY